MLSMQNMNKDIPKTRDVLKRHSEDRQVALSFGRKVDQDVYVFDLSANTAGI
jgi:hypothetical protein